MTDQQHAFYDEFNEHVNMTASELKKWLESDKSQSVGAKQANAQEKSGAHDESTGHAMGREIVELLGKKQSELSDDDFHDMKKVSGYVKRHLAQEPGKEDIETSKWRYSLMNWGHDPLKQ